MQFKRPGLVKVYTSWRSRSGRRRMYVEASSFPGAGRISRRDIVVAGCLAFAFVAGGLLILHIWL